MVGERGCPKCGEGLLVTTANPTVDAALRTHCATRHPGAIGFATAPERDGFRFCYVRPVEMMSEPHWWVIVLDGPAQLVKLRPAVWTITWANPAVRHGAAV